MGTSDCSGSLGIERYASPYQSEINQPGSGRGPEPTESTLSHIVI